MKNDDNKQDCIESISKALRRTSAWRRSLIVRWPDDLRNKRAADRLDKLAEDVASLTDAQWVELQPYHGSGWEALAWRDGLNLTARQVGFHFRAGDLDFFVRALIQNLSISSSVAA